MAKGKSGKMVSFAITLSPRGVWVRDWLLETTDAKNDSDVIRNALRLHLTLLRAYGKRTTLLSQQGGKKPFPVHLLAPATLLELPPEASFGTAQRLTIALNRKSQPAFDELKRLTQVDDPSTAMENALCLHYDLLNRHLQAATFFIRDSSSSRFERVELFATNE